MTSTSPKSPFKQRTIKQNSAFYKWCEAYASDLRDAGIDLRILLLHDNLEAPMTKDIFKSVIVNNFCKAIYGTEHSSELSTKQLSKLCEVVSDSLNREYGVFTDFPSAEQLVDNPEVEKDDESWYKLHRG